MSDIASKIIDLIEQYGIVNEEMANDELMLMTIPRRGQSSEQAEQISNHMKRAAKHAHRGRAASELAALVRDLVAKAKEPSK